MDNTTKIRPPNILLIMTDQMRGDCMGVAGHPDVKTPNLDHLASMGVRQSGREQYFRLDTDPKELHDAVGDPDCQERIACLRRILIQELEGREEGYTDGVSLIPGRGQRSCLSFLPDRQ